MSNKLHGLLCLVANNDSRLVLVTGTGTGSLYSIMIHTFIPEVKLSDVLFDNH